MTFSFPEPSWDSFSSQSGVLGPPGVMEEVPSSETLAASFVPLQSWIYASVSDRRRKVCVDREWCTYPSRNHSKQQPWLKLFLWHELAQHSEFKLCLQRKCKRSRCKRSVMDSKWKCLIFFLNVSNTDKKDTYAAKSHENMRCRENEPLISTRPALHVAPWGFWQTPAGSVSQRNTSVNTRDPRSHLRTAGGNTALVCHFTCHLIPSSLWWSAAMQVQRPRSFLSKFTSCGKLQTQQGDARRIQLSHQSVISPRRGDAGGGISQREVSCSRFGLFAITTCCDIKCRNILSQQPWNHAQRVSAPLPMSFLSQVSVVCNIWTKSLAQKCVELRREREESWGSQALVCVQFWVPSELYYVQKLTFLLKSGLVLRAGAKGLVGLTPCVSEKGKFINLIEEPWRMQEALVFSMQAGFTHRFFYCCTRLCF